MELQLITLFIRAYLGVHREQGINESIREFIQAEGPTKVAQLRNDLKEILSQDISDSELRILIEKEGNYSLSPKYPSARAFFIDLFKQLQVMGPYVKNEKIYDVFISYSWKDRTTAERLALELKHQGFTIWLDQWEVLVGHNIIDQVYKGIRASQFMIVVLTKESSQSQWVKEELTQGRLREIEQQSVYVLPVKIEDCEIPEPLKTKRYADFSKSWDEGMWILLASLSALKLDMEIQRPTIITPDENIRIQRLMGFYNETVKEIEDLGWPSHEGYKDVVIGPQDSVLAKIPKEDIISIVQDCQVRLMNWGGPRFPYDVHPHTKRENLSDGIRVYDKEPWPFSAWSFFFWRMNEHGYFMHRTYLNEDHMLGDNNQYTAKGQLIVNWIIKDICSSLLFAHRLINRLPQLSSTVVYFNWSGLANRRLGILGHRVPFFNEYKCAENHFKKKVTINQESDLPSIAFDIIKEILWLFGWESFSQNQVQEDIMSILSGTFPR